MTRKAECSPSAEGDTSKRQHPDDPLTGRDCLMCEVPLRGAKQRRYCSNACRDKANKLSYKWGLSPAEYRALLADTGGRCPICMRETDRWNVEHDHTTMAVTGLVCAPCNIGLLAHSKHDPALVQRLLTYLENPPADWVLGRRHIAPETAERESSIHEIWRNHESGSVVGHTPTDEVEDV